MEDFRVDEVLGFEPAGEGGHGWFLVRYAGMNTLDMARELARFCEVPLRDIGFSGLKDRYAITSQWFSIPLDRGGPEPDPGIGKWLREDGKAELLVASANARKLKRGVHRANRFHIVIRQLAGDWDKLDARLRAIRQLGVPNYFGPQRFGRRDGNLETAVRWFSGRGRPGGRQARSMALSAARSWLFNQVLSQRIDRWPWNHILPGDRMMLAGSRSHFAYDGDETGVLDRIRRGDIHPSGPLWGAGEPACVGDAAAFEQAIIDSAPLLRDGLANAGLRQERRSLRLLPESMDWRLDEADRLDIEFTLPAGAFATAVLRELVESGEAN